MPIMPKAEREELRELISDYPSERLSAIPAIPQLLTSLDEAERIIGECHDALKIISKDGTGTGSYAYHQTRRFLGRE